MQCGSCGTRLERGEPACPGCGAHLLTALCGRCGHRGPREEFPFHRCSVCGHRADLGGRIILPIAIAVLAVLILVLSIRRREMMTPAHLGR